MGDFCQMLPAFPFLLNVEYFYKLNIDNKKINTGTNTEMS